MLDGWICTLHRQCGFSSLKLKLLFRSFANTFRSARTTCSQQQRQLQLDGDSFGEHDVWHTRRDDEHHNRASDRRLHRRRPRAVVTGSREMQREAVTSKVARHQEYAASDAGLASTRGRPRVDPPKSAVGAGSALYPKCRRRLRQSARGLAVESPIDLSKRTFLRSEIYLGGFNGIFVDGGGEV